MVGWIALGLTILTIAVLLWRGWQRAQRDLARGQWYADKLTEMKHNQRHNRHGVEIGQTCPHCRMPVQEGIVNARCGCNR